MKRPLRSRLHEQRWGVYFSHFEGMMGMVVLGAPLVLFAEFLGASTVQVGLVGSFTELMLVVQVLATSWLGFVGYRRQVLYSMWGRVLFILGLLLLVSWSQSGPVGLLVYGLIGLVMGYCILRAMAHAAYYPWLYGLLPKDTVGRYFAIEQVGINIGAVIILFGGSFIFKEMSDRNGFLSIFVIALICGIIGTFSIAKLRDVPVLAGSTNFKEWVRNGLSLCLKQSPYRSYLMNSVSWAALGCPIYIFAVYYLKVGMGLSDSVILFYTAIQFVGCALGGFVVMGLVDRLGVKLLFIVALGTCIAIFIYWACFIYFKGAWSIGIPVTFFLLGFETALWYTANYKYLGQITPAKEQVFGVSLQTALVGISAGLSPILVGKWLSMGVGPGLVNDNCFILYLLVATMGMLGLFKSLMGILHETGIEVIEEPELGKISQ